MLVRPVQLRMKIYDALINTIQLLMPVTLRLKTYEWLKQIGVFRQQPLLISPSSQLCEIPYDEQIYLHNGYLIGVALRKFVKTYSSQYKQLLKVRKIATLKSSQNWNIIEPYLMRIGYDSLIDRNHNISQNDDEQSKKIGQTDVEISLQNIGDILQLIYDKFSPEEVENKMKNARRAKHNFIDIYNFTSTKPLSEAENTLEMMCIILARNLEITLGEAMGLLMEKCKYFKKLVVEGSKKDEFQSIKKLYEDTIESWPIFEEYFLASPQDSFKILDGLSEGLLSQNTDIVHLTLNLLSSVTQEQWFIKEGYYKLLSSTHIQCFYFTIEKLSPDYEKILNESLHSKISDKIKLFTILLNLIKTLPRTIYCKEIFAHVPISYFYEQCYSVLNIQEIDEQPPKVVVRAKELLAKLVVTYPDKIPNQYLSSVLDTFKYNGNRPYGQTYHTLALLFEILEGVMRKQSPHIEKFFKVVMKYLKETFGEVKHWIIENLRELYERMRKLFPLGCMLVLYSMDSVAQADEYNLFSLICNDTHRLSQQESMLTLQYLTKYITTQLHCKCFLPLVHSFLAHHSGSSGRWAEEQCLQILEKIQQINIPMLNEGQINVLNPKPPVRNKVINSIGMKRKEMLKYNEYELAKQMIKLLLHVRDKSFLNYYSNMIGHTITGIEKEIGHKKKQLVNLLKNTRKQIKKKIDQIPDSQNMDEIMKSMVNNRAQSVTSHAPAVNRNLLVRPPLVGGSTTQSKYPLSQSRLLDSYVYRNTKTIQEEDEEVDDKNQFINSKLKASDQNRTENKDEQVSDNQESIWRGTPDQDGQWRDHLNKAHGRETHKIGLMDFTQQSYDEVQDHSWQVQIYSNESLESHQIAYIKSILQKYSSVMSVCTQVYEQCIQNFKQVDNFLPKFMSRLGLASLIQSHKSELIFLKCKTVFPSAEHSQLVSNFLVQLAFQIFAFKQDRRVRVTCVESLFRVIYDNIRELVYTKSRVSKTEAFTQSIKYQNSINPKIFSSIPQQGNASKLKSFSLCFQILSEICFTKLGVHLVEPISKQVSELGSPPMLPTLDAMTPSLVVRHKTQNSNRQGSLNYGDFDQKNDNEAEEELNFLQKQLQKLEIPEEQEKIKQRDRKSANFTLKSMKRMKLRETKAEGRNSNQELLTKANKILTNNDAIKTKPNDSSTPLPTNSKQLRSKLSQRIKQLHGQLAKQSAKSNQLNSIANQKHGASTQQARDKVANNTINNTNSPTNNNNSNGDSQS